MNFKIILSLLVIGLLPIIFDNSYAQITSGGFGQSPFERNFGDVKFLDAYFGTLDEKIEVEAGDSNVPFTVVFANVGTQDITGIRGQLSLPLSFSASDGPDAIIHADSNSNSLAGENFHLTFFVNICPILRVCFFSFFIIQVKKFIYIIMACQNLDLGQNLFCQSSLNF